MAQGKRYLRLFVKLFLSALIIGAVSLRADWQKIGVSLNQVNCQIFVLSFVATLMTVWVNGLKYSKLVAGTHLSESAVYFSKINLISRYYALLIPTAIGTEAIRWYKVTKGRQGKGLFFSLTLIERLFFVFSICIFSIVPIVLFPLAYPGAAAFVEKIIPLLIAAFAAVVAVLLSFLVPGINLRIQRMIRLRPVTEVYNLVLKQFPLNGSGARKLLWVTALSLIWQLLFVVRIYLIVLSLNIDVSLSDISWISSLILLLQVLPVSFAGIGVREGAYAYVFILMGLPFEKGVLTGILCFVQMLVLAVMGLFLELSSRKSGAAG